MPGWHCGSNGIGLSSTFPMPREPASYPRAPAPHSRSSAPSPPALAPGRYGSAFVIAIARTALPFRVFSIAVRDVWKTLSSANFPGCGERVDHAALYAVEKILDCRTQPCEAGPKSIARRLDSMRQAPPPHDVQFGPMNELAEMARIASGCTARLTPEQVRLGRIGRFLWLRLDVNRYHRSKTRSPHQPHFSLGHFSCQSVPFRVRERASSASGIA